MQLHLLSNRRKYPLQMSGIATIGGSAASFQQVAAHPLNLMPLIDYSGSHLLANCVRQAQQRRRRHEPRYEGPNREGALFCRSGTWLQILDRRNAESLAREKGHSRPDYIWGAHNESSIFSVLEFISVAFGLVSIRGKASQRYLCMGRDGRLYGAVKENYSSECIFMEEMLENYYNLYSSCSYGTKRRRWYISLRSDGQPKRGKHSRKRRKSSHFLVVHFDGDLSNRGYNMASESRDGSIHLSSQSFTRAHRYGYNMDAYMQYGNMAPPASLSEIMSNTPLLDSKQRTSSSLQSKATETVRRTAPKKSGTNAIGSTADERKVNKRKRRRKARLEREERQRQRRRQQLQMEREKAYRQELLRTGRS